jgi:hypothetical protein
VPVVVLLSLVLGLALLLDWWPFLRGGFGWVWPYKSPNLTRLVRLLPGLLVLVVYGFGVVFLFRRANWLYIAWCLLGAVAVPTSLLIVTGDPIFLLLSRTISGQATSAFAVASHITNLRATYAGWLEAMPGMFDPLPHMSTSSPIWPTLYYGLGRILAGWPNLSAQLALPLMRLQCQNYSFIQLGQARVASAWIGMLSPVWTALTVVPLYGLAKKLAGEKSARLAVACWPLVPAPALFAATLSTAYVPFATTAVLLFWHALHQARPIRMFVWMLLAGATMMAIIMWNMSVGPLVLLCILLALIVWLQDVSRISSLRYEWLLSVGASFGLGMLAVSGLYTLAIGHSPVTLFLSVMKVHTGMQSAYLPWLGLHTWDFVLYAGVPIIALALIEAFSVRAEGPRRLSLALGLTLGALILSGIGRGETGRVWMFLMPMVVLLAGLQLAELPVLQRALLLGAQVTWLLILSLVIRPISTPDVVPPPTYQALGATSLESPIVTVDADFGTEMHLLGYQARYHPALHSLDVVLHWQARQPMATPYYFSLVPVDPGGNALPGQVWQPFATRYPTTCWWPDNGGDGQVVERVSLALPAGSRPGNWWLSLSAFAYSESRQSQPLATRLPNGQLDHQVGLGPISVMLP